MDSIALFYELNHKKGKKYTYDHFKDCGPSQLGIYKILTRFDERGNVDRKSGQGRPKSLTNQNKKKVTKSQNLLFDGKCILTHKSSNRRAREVYNTSF